MDVLSPFIPVLGHSDWLFRGESCLRLDVVHPGRAWPSSPACTWHGDHPADGLHVIGGPSNHDTIGEYRGLICAAAAMLLVDTVAVATCCICRRDLFSHCL